MRRVALATPLALLALCVGAFLLARSASAQGQSCVGVGQDVQIPAGQSCQEVVAIGGDIVVRGSVQGSAVAIGGSVRVDGTVHGDVVSLGGEVLLQSGARVEGSVTALGGVLYRGPGSQVRGDLLESGLIFPRPGMTSDLPRSSWWVRFGLGVLAFALAVGVSLLLSLALRSLWPRRTRVMLETLRQQPLLSLLMGVLSGFLLVVLSPLLSVVLIATVVGIPLVPLLYLLVLLAYVVALTISGMVLGEVLGDRVRDRRIPGALRYALGVGVVAALVVFPSMASPWLGLPWAALVLSAGLGAITLSRIGTVWPAQKVASST